MPGYCQVRRTEVFRSGIKLAKKVVCCVATDRRCVRDSVRIRRTGELEWKAKVSSNQKGHEEWPDSGTVASLSERRAGFCSSK